MVTNIFLTFADKAPGFLDAVLEVAEEFPEVQVSAAEFDLVTEVYVTAPDINEIQNALLTAAMVGNVAFQDYGLFLVALSTSDENEVDNG